MSQLTRDVPNRLPQFLMHQCNTVNNTKSPLPIIDVKTLVGELEEINRVIKSYDAQIWRDTSWVQLGHGNTYEIEVSNSK